MDSWERPGRTISKRKTSVIGGKTKTSWKEWEKTKRAWELMITNEGCGWNCGRPNESWRREMKALVWWLWFWCWHDDWLIGILAIGIAWILLTGADVITT